MPTRYIVIGQDGRPHGPLTVDEIAAWVREGYAGRYSRARRENENDWQALQDFPDLREIVTAPVRSEVAASNEGQTSGAVHRTVNIVSSFSRAWALVSRHFIELAGWSLAAGLLLFMVYQIPRIGWFLGLIVNSVLAGGISMIYLARIRGRRVVLKDLTGAIQGAAVNLCLVGLTQTLFTVAGTFLLIAPGLYLAVAYVFAVTLAIDKRLHFWTALELSRRAITRQWWPMFGLILAAVILVFGGVLTYGIGLVLAVPLSTAALMYAYEDVFGD